MGKGKGGYYVNIQKQQLIFVDFAIEIIVSIYCNITPWVLYYMRIQIHLSFCEERQVRHYRACSGKITPRKKF